MNNDEGTQLNQEPDPRSWYTNADNVNRNMNHMNVSETTESNEGRPMKQRNTSTVNESTNNNANTRANKAVKNCVLDLAGNIPESQRNILNLGPKFAVPPKSIRIWRL